MHVESDAQQWAEGVVGRCELGDKRRTHRLVTMVAHLASHVGSSPYAAFRGDEAGIEGAYRLLRNDAVEPEAIAQGAYESAVRAAAGCAEVLALEDSTTLSYGHGAREALGDLGGPAGGTHRGFQVHSVLLVDAHSERTLGLAEQQRWRRDSAARGQRHRRAERVYEDKESFKWQRASQRLAERMGEAMSRVISVCDREADVFAYLAHKVECGERFVVRAACNRRTEDEVLGGLFEQLEAAPVVGHERVRIPQRGGRRARDAQVELRACEVEVLEPRAGARGRRLRLNALLAHEPEGGREALRWVLLSSERIDDEASARRVLRYYGLRWRIEEFHKAWKSGGTDVERRRMQTPDNLERIAVMLAVVAVRLLQLREALEEPREQPGAASAPAPRRCDEVLEDIEWKILWLTRENQPLPQRPPSLRWAYESLARLGGWGDSKRTGRAGWKALWEGWFRLDERVTGYRLAQQLNPSTDL